MGLTSQLFPFWQGLSSRARGKQSLAKGWAQWGGPWLPAELPTEDVWAQQASREGGVRPANDMI